MGAINGILMGIYAVVVVGMLCSRTIVKHTFNSMMSTYRKRWKINLYRYIFFQYRVQRGLKAVEFCLIFIEIS